MLNDRRAESTGLGPANGWPQAAAELRRKSQAGTGCCDGLLRRPIRNGAAARQPGYRRAVPGQSQPARWVNAIKAMTIAIQTTKDTILSHSCQVHMPIQAMSAGQVRGFGRRGGVEMVMAWDATSCRYVGQVGLLTVTYSYNIQERVLR